MGLEDRERSLNNPNRSIVQASEPNLVEQAMRGEREARRELFERYREAAYAAAYRITGRSEDALDVVQDAFIKAFENLEGFHRDASFKTWLMRIVSNQALTLLRSRKVRLAVPLGGGDDDGSEVTAEPAARDEEGGALKRMEQQELAQRLRRAMESLPAEQRAVFAMYATGEMTYGAIAEALDVPIGTVMSRLYHARRKLQELLGPDGV